MYIPINVKFGKKEHTVGLLSYTKFGPDWHPENLKIGHIYSILAVFSLRYHIC